MASDGRTDRITLLALPAEIFFFFFFFENIMLAGTRLTLANACPLRDQYIVYSPSHTNICSAASLKRSMCSYVQLFVYIGTARLVLGWTGAQRACVKLANWKCYFWRFISFLKNKFFCFFDKTATLTINNYFDWTFYDFWSLSCCSLLNS